VRAAGVLAKGRMFDMPGVGDRLDTWDVDIQNDLPDRFAFLHNIFTGGQ